MKNILKTTLLIAATALFVSSCTGSKKQNCDAYGSISKIENNKTVVTSSADEKVGVEIKS